MPTLKAWAMRMCRQGADADDLVQETLERAYLRFDAFAAGTNLQGWLFCIMRRIFVDRCRRERVRVTSPLSPDLAMPEKDAIPNWRRVSERALDRATDSLPSALRGTYLMFAQRGFRTQTSRACRRYLSPPSAPGCSERASTFENT